ncbi:alpha/beta hydrolase [Actinomadura parmotrematis]|uniref:Alpha/beta hydrolase n=1 Tax=Actinomadura parmotrematis TaxID=2864039 RepID=A0ABS7G050_9ACTN|nr:alpha/beta hydrolase [Actinomadura parmotrematis]MBW8485770.1 alpha/beta hydrolase [Actinomadura parmotrematis]
MNAPASGAVGPPPPFDPEVAAVLAAIDVPPLPFTLENLPKLREQRAVLPPPSLAELARDGAYRVEERAVPGPAGAPDVTLLICVPTDAEGPVPVLYHAHGGGMIFGDERTMVTEVQDWTERRTAIVSVGYRLAPETPHPGPVEDCYAGLLWTAAHAAELGLDPERIIVGGVSAGGGLAAALALMARDRGGPALLGQLLVCPMLDDRNDTPSAVQMAGLGIWDRTANDTGWTALLGDARGGPDVSPYAAPARAADLSGLPPAFIDAGSAETFRDEDVAYATRIWQAGGVAELHVWPGGCHAFDMFVPHAPIAAGAREARTRWLRRLLAATD